jgi:hypothetical protein
MKFEYKVVRIHWGHGASGQLKEGRRDHDVSNAKLEGLLNRLGAERWQLSGTLRDEHESDDHEAETTLLIMSRPVTDK